MINECSLVQDMLYDLFEFDPLDGQLGYSSGVRQLCTTSVQAVKAAEAVYAFHWREVTAAEANMAILLRQVADYLADRHKLGHHCLWEVRADLEMHLRVAVVDLTHGLDPDIDDAGLHLVDAARGLLEIVGSTESQRLDKRAVLLLRSVGDAIAAARFCDVLAQADRSGPVTVYRPGYGDLEI